MNDLAKEYMQQLRRTGTLKFTSSLQDEGWAIYIDGKKLPHTSPSHVMMLFAQLNCYNIGMIMEGFQNNMCRRLIGTIYMAPLNHYLKQNQRG